MAADFYARLEVTYAATFEEIRAAYRRLARAYHPDTNPSADAITRMREVNEAWETLRDTQKREQYNRTLRVARPAQPVRRGPTVRRQPPSAATARAQRAWQEEEDAPRAERRTYDGDPAVDWYAILGVRPDAPRQQIQKRLGELASQLGGADISATEFTRRRNEMRAAWAVLSDPHVRAAYDAARRDYAAFGARPAPAPEPATEMPAGHKQGPVVINGLFVDKGAVLPVADLRGADLRGLDLAGIVLREAKLQGADLEGASLRRADLRGADLSGANLRWADLSHADCSGATLRQANLARASLNATKFIRSNLGGASFEAAIGPGVNLDYADVARTDFTAAKITASLIERAKLNETIFPDGTVHS